MQTRNSFFLESENSSFDRSDGSIPSPRFASPSPESGSNLILPSYQGLYLVITPFLKAWDQRPRGIHRLLRNRRIVLLLLSWALIFVCIASIWRGEPVITFLDPNESLSRASVRDLHGLGRRMEHKRMKPVWVKEKLKLNAQEELAAVIAFMAASESNALPPSVDPNHSLDAAYILGFDPHTKRAKQEVAALVKDTWDNYPVVLLSRRYSPVGREIRSMLSSFKFKVAPLVWDLDEREDSQVMISVLFRLTNMTELPVLLARGSVVGVAATVDNGDGDKNTPISYIEQIRSLNETGSLQRLLTGDTSAGMDLRED